LERHGGHAAARRSQIDCPRPRLVVPSVITTLAVHGYRSLRDLVVPLGGLTVVTGANGSGKSSLYQAFRLLSTRRPVAWSRRWLRPAACRRSCGQVPRRSRVAMRDGEVPVQGKGSRRRPVSLMLGFRDGGVLVPGRRRSPYAEQEPVRRRSGAQARGGLGRARAPARPHAADPPPGRREGARRNAGGRRWSEDLGPRASVLTTLCDRARLSGARGRTGGRVVLAVPRRHPHANRHAPARQPQIRHLVADPRPRRAEPRQLPWRPYGSRPGRQCSTARSPMPSTARPLEVTASDEGLFFLSLRQPGMLRPMGVAELSDGTLRYVAMATALLSPRARRRCWSSTSRRRAFILSSPSRWRD